MRVYYAECVACAWVETVESMAQAAETAKAHEKASHKKKPVVTFGWTITGKTARGTILGG